MKTIPLLFLFIVGCVLPPALREEQDRLKAMLRDQNERLAAFQAERLALEEKARQGGVTEAQRQEAMESIALREAETGRQVADLQGRVAEANVRIREFQEKQKTAVISGGFDIAGSIWSVLGTLLIPLVPALAAVGPILSGVKGVFKKGGLA